MAASRTPRPPIPARLGLVALLLSATVLAGCTDAPVPDHGGDRDGAFARCDVATRPAARGYAVAATGPDGHVRIHAGFDGAAETSEFTDQSLLADRWVFNATSGCWSLVGPSPSLNWAFAYAASTDTYVGYDTQVDDDLPLIVGGANPLSEIWTLTSTGEWQVERRADMVNRNGPVMAYDADQDRVVLFGGCAGFAAACLNETWVHDPATGTWTRTPPGPTPAGRSFAAMEHDPRFDGLILFGGHVQVGPPSDETWLYDVATATWTLLDLATSPPGRVYPQLAYAEDIGRLYLFGGSADGGQLNDLWYLDAANLTWVEVTAEDPPTPRAWHAMGYDEVEAALVVFGGGQTGGDFRNYHDDTWVFDLATGQWGTPDLR